MGPYPHGQGAAPRLGPTAGTWGTGQMAAQPRGVMLVFEILHADPTCRLWELGVFQTLLCTDFFVPVFGPFPSIPLLNSRKSALLPHFESVPWFGIFLFNNHTWGIRASWAETSKCTFVLRLQKVDYCQDNNSTGIIFK